MNFFSKALLKWKGGQGSSRAASRLLQRDLFQVVLRPEKYQGGAAQTLGGEPAVPGIIPGGVASCPIPGRSGSNP